MESRLNGKEGIRVWLKRSECWSEEPGAGSTLDAPSMSEWKMFLLMIGLIVFRDLKAVR
ncbi:MAG: hypothetical protein ACXAC5_03000 [Promethearchaeota archaeon]